MLNCIVLYIYICSPWKCLEKKFIAAKWCPEGELSSGIYELEFWLKFVKVPYFACIFSVTATSFGVNLSEKFCFRS